jgi:hypothetical protein
MSYPARGPVGKTGIDGKASADHTDPHRIASTANRKRGVRMSYPARGPVGKTGIDGKASADPYRRAADIDTQSMEMSQ